MKIKKILKGVSLTILWTVVAVFLLVVGLITTVVKVLNPDRLTPLVERCASAYLNADVEASRVELTFWSSFPEFRVEVDSLEVVSRSLNGVPDSIASKIPAGADSLLNVGSFTGSIDISKFFIGKIAIKDVIVDRPMVNLVMVNDKYANYDIVPPSEEEDTTAFVMPDISIDRFAITNARPFRFTSVSDSISGSVQLKTVEISGDLPVYKLQLGGDFATPLLNQFNLQGVDLALNGGVSWNNDAPKDIEVSDFTVGVGPLSVNLNTQINFDQTLTVNALNVKLNPLKVAELVKHVPADYVRMATPLRTDMMISADAKLVKPYVVGGLALPSVNVTANVPECYVKYNQIDLRKFGFEVEAKYVGSNVDASVVNVKRLLVEGPATRIDFSGKASSLFTDPAFDGEVSANMVIDRLPQQLRRLIPARLTGKLVADLSFKGRKSYLHPNHFHKLKVEGGLTGNDINLEMRDSNLNAWIRKIEVNFGTSNSFVKDEVRVDSLLTASLKVDTAQVSADGINLSMSKFAAGVGSANRRGSAVKGQINPIGASISVHRLKMDSPSDSSRIRLRDVNCRASLTRFEGDSKVPQLGLNLNAKRISLRNPQSLFSLREGDINVVARYKPRSKTRRIGAKLQALYDSIMVAQPTLTSDEAMALARTERRKVREQEIAQANHEADITFEVDSGFKNLLRRWDIRGTFKAKRGRMSTPYFPLRNTLSNIDVTITNDSLLIQNVKYKVGQSDFLIYGVVSNIRRVLTSRKHTPLEIDFGLESDTINVNEIVNALFAGSSYSGGSSEDVFDDETEEVIDEPVAVATDSATGPLLIPRNIRATFRMRAKNIIYADLLLKRFRGNLMVNDGAVSLERLSARTDIGGINMSALYSAPDRDNLQFGFGMKVKDFRIDKFNQLFPAIDSVMPMMSELSGVVNADIAATTDIDQQMNLKIPSLRAAVKIEGDSLVLLDAETFKVLSKWLFFKDKKRNLIDHMAVEAVIENSNIQLYPFMFNIDRYKLGVMGSNDLALNYNYHVSVLKSVVPFKFGINIKGTPDKMKIRLGGAKFKENMVGQSSAIVDTTRINLIEKMQSVFRKGVTAARLGSLDLRGRPRRDDFDDLTEDSLTYSDSLRLYNEGILDTPPTPPPTLLDDADDGKKDKKKNKKSKK